MKKRLNGIYQNCHPIDQPEGFYRHALNITLDENIGAVVNEKGTTQRYSLPSGYKVIGTILLPDDRVVIFSTNNTVSKIGIFNGTSYTELVSANLNFNTNNPIHGVSYKDDYDDLYIFWVDGRNNARFLNVNNPDPNHLELFPSSDNTPNISIHAINSSGGQLKAGAYYFSAAYIHKDRTITNFFTVIGPVYINGREDAGSQPDEITSKSITLNLNNLDTKYETVQLAVIPSYEGILGEVQLLPEIPTSSTAYTYTGNEAYRVGSLEEIQIDKAYYEKPKCITIHDDSLLLGNLQEPEELDLQPYVNNIKVKAEIETLENAFDNNSSLSNSYKNLFIASTKKGFKRGEVYAIYISFILKNGRETKAFHIPGRPPRLDETNPVPNLGQRATTPYIEVLDKLGVDTTINQFSVTHGTNSTDIAFTADMEAHDIANHIANQVNSDPNQNITCEVRAGTEIRFVEKRIGSQYNGEHVILEGDQFILDIFSLTSVTLTGGIDANNPLLADAKNFHLVSNPDPIYNMGYWENHSELYPNSDEWLIKDANGLNIGDLRGLPVRHHHFPSDSSAGFRITQNGDKDINILGFKLLDVNIPTQYKDQIVGYKVYVAERTEENKRRLDQAITIANRVDNGVLVASNDNDGQSVQSIFYTHPFHYLRTRKNVGGVSHIDVRTQLNRISVPISDSGDYRRSFNDYYYSTPFATGINAIKPVNAIAYVDTADGEVGVNMQRYGFGVNFNNYGGESKLVIDVVGATGLDSSNAYLVDICAHKLDLYNSFDLQTLSFTGYVHRNMSNTNSGLIFGGDIYITPYTFRASRRDGNLRRVTLHRMIYESVDNIDYRRSGENPWDVFFPLVSADKALYVDYRSDGVPQLGDSDLEIYENYLSYSNDLSMNNNIRYPGIHSKIRQTTTTHTTRVIRNTGGIRTFLQEDYLDISKKRGSLIKLTTYNNLLIPHLERAILRTRGKEELQVADIRAFLGTGDIFSVAPEELIFTEDGFGGLQNISHALSTPYGYYFIDYQAKRVYRLDNDGISDISEPLRPLFDSAPSSFRLGYNPIAETVLFTNDSWTYSFSPKRNAWISEHSYKPERYFNTQYKIFACVNNVIHEHEIGNRGRYYNTTYDTIFQYVDNEEPTISKVAQSLRINSRVL